MLNRANFEEMMDGGKAKTGMARGCGAATQGKGYNK